MTRGSRGSSHTASVATQPHASLKPSHRRAGISRATLYRKLDKHGIAVSRR